MKENTLLQILKSKINKDDVILEFNIEKLSYEQINSVEEAIYNVLDQINMNKK